ncbi:MAG: amino acid ABC transporter permease [Anaerolineales bacterium]|nr:amino acid ABC transporter permease [Anaerolineales bacterium]MCW5854996.1 amino acid ABC transporter permease [Anaerolineales bacterium]
MSDNILPPLIERPSLLSWIYKNLFNTWYNALLSLLSGALIFWIVRAVVIWLLEVAQWRVIVTNLRLIMLGQFPISEVWRVWLGLALLALIAGNSLGIWGRKARGAGRVTIGLLALLLGLATITSGQSQLWLLGMAGLLGFGWWVGRSAGKGLERVVITGWVIWPPIFILLLRGLGAGNEVLPLVGTNLWGGLLLTLLLTIVGIVFSFPLGVLLALGRRSSLPIVRWFSVAYIELIRGVPLITLLFMAQLMLPLFLPTGVNIDRVLRAMVAITLFSAAYLAENVRGGLQAIPKGQYEAAYAMGLNNIQSMGLIIMPQALRLVIPILVGQFIALFKDTALVSIVGLMDLVGIGKTVLAQPEFLGLQREVYAFISMLYWVISYAMAYVSQRLEVSLGVGER